MTAATLETALLLYPSIWELRENARELILEENNRNENSGGRHGNSVADRTAAKAIRLVEFDEKLSAFDVITKWIDCAMSPEDRELLLLIWRGIPWDYIARKMYLTKQEVGRRWHQMTVSLIRYAGIAAGGRGPACVSIRG